jgi:predicted DCC family thiol-disulfide oxidoreductase YuxK
MAHSVDEAATRPIILYDGVCGLCNRLNQFVLKRDRHDRVRFAALQSAFGRAALQRHGRDAGALETVCVLVPGPPPGERLLVKSDAILFILRELGGGWRLAAALNVVPRVLRDLAYDQVARTRYRVFGKLDACPLPEERHRRKFIG